MSTWVYIGVVALGMFLSLLVIYLSALLFSGKSESPRSPQAAARFLFHGNLLVDHNLNDHTDFASERPDLRTWDDFRNWMFGRFGPLPQSLEQQYSPDPLILREEHGMATVEIFGNENGHHVILDDPDRPSPTSRHQQLYKNQRLQNDQITLDYAPCAILRIDTKTGLRTENALWKSFSQEQKAMLDDAISEIVECDITQSKLVSFNLPTGQKCLELSAHVSPNIRAFYATDISELVEAKNAQRAFLQTLTKTFANLSTGLCIFDRDHQLVLFNPALVNLTQLPINFLSARPNMMGFFDKLRDLQMMPEPKNYAAWRIQINQMIASAIGGSYDETWPLPNGLTYRITGRPHPDGAVAFLIENITEDVVLTRRFRSQIDIRQAALDSLDDAIAIFSPAKTLLFCNATLSELIGFDPDQSIAEVTALELINQLKIATTYKHGWTMIEKRFFESSAQIPFSEILHSKDMPSLLCEVVALNGNLKMLKLTYLHGAKAQASQPEIA